MIRNLLRNWLRVPNANESVMSTPTHDPEAWFFSIKPVDNGYIITFRTYPLKDPKVPRPYSEEPGYTDKIRLVHQNDNLIEVLGAMIVEENIKR